MRQRAVTESASDAGAVHRDHRDVGCRDKDLAELGVAAPDEFLAGRSWTGSAAAVLDQLGDDGLLWDVVLGVVDRRQQLIVVVGCGWQRPQRL